MQLPEKKLNTRGGWVIPLTTLCGLYLRDNKRHVTDTEVSTAFQGLKQGGTGAHLEASYMKQRFGILVSK